MGCDVKTIKGLHTHRCKDSPEEKRFADAWVESNKHGKTLAYLLTEPEHAGRGRPLDPLCREHEIAATVIQWLGSPVGQSFLRDLGYERVAEERERGAL